MSRKNTPSKKQVAHTPEPTWRNNYMKVRPTDAPLDARCAVVRKAGENLGRYFWKSKEFPEYFRWDDEVGDEDRASFSTTEEVPLAPRQVSRTLVIDSDEDRVPPKSAAKTPVKPTQQLFEMAVRDDIVRLEDSFFSFQARAFEKLASFQRRVDDLTMDHTKALLRINDLESMVQILSTPIPPPKPTSPTFLEALDEAKKDRKRKDEDSRTMHFLEKQHRMQNQEAADLQSPIKKPRLEKAESVDLVEEALEELAQEKAKKLTSPFREKAKKDSKDAVTPVSNNKKS